MKFLQHIAGLAAVAAVAAAAHAQSFNVDVGTAAGAGAGAPSSAFSAAAAQPGFWNNFVGSGTALALTDLNGASSSVTLTRSTSAGDGFNSNNAGTSGNFELLMDDGQDLSAATGAVTYTFSGLQNGVYDIYTYSWAPDFRPDLTAVTVNGNTQTVGATLLAPDTFTLGRTHALHAGIAVGGGTLVVSAVGAPSNFGTINGFQLVRRGLALNLNATSSCYHVGDTITVNVNVTGLPYPATGGQYFINFDSTKLQFLNAVPGDPGLPGSGPGNDFPPFPPPTNPNNPFEVEVYQCTGQTVGGVCVSVPGRLDYAVGVVGTSPGSAANNTMAVLRFTALTEICNAADLVIFRDNTLFPPFPPSRLTDAFGGPINPVLNNLGPITVDNTAPVITCPPTAKVECPVAPTPANTGTATAIDACDATPTIAYFDLTVDIFSSPSGWASRNENTATGTTVVGPPTPPMGIGSFSAQTGSGTGPGLGGKNYLFTGLFDNMPLVSISEMKYWTYVAASGNPNLAPSLNLYVDWDNNGTRDTTMIFEPTYVTGGAIPAGWQQWNALGAANAWWYNTSFGSLTSPAGEYHPLSYYLAIYPNARIVNWAGAPGFNIVTGQASGGPWANFSGNIDLVEINGFNFDFEPGPFCAHTIFRTWTATDDCNNTSSCLQQIFVIDVTPPVFSSPCPLPTINVNADAGTCEASYATVNPAVPTATDACSTATVTFTRSDGKPSLTSSYAAADSPIIITWTAKDACGNQSICTQTVNVGAYNELLLTIQLQPNIAPTGNLTRCITLDLWRCAPNFTTTVSAPITFTVSPNLPNPNIALAASAVVLVPCGNYTCITARDRLHTLRRTDEGFGIVGTKYVADFTGDPSSGGDWLLGGNLNDDQYIDILDFGTFISQYGGPGYGTGNTTCSTPYPHADISGDGLVTSGDYTFIQINFLKFHEANCCGAALRMAGGDNGNTNSDQPITRISVRELIRLGMKDLTVADLNNDGWLDTADAQQFMAGGSGGGSTGRR